MQFRRSGQGDQRRRRVLLEENLADSASNRSGEDSPKTAAERRAGTSLRLYTPDALADQQPTIAAFIPQRIWTLAILVLSGLAVIAGLQAAAGQLLLRPQTLWPSVCRSLDLETRGGLAAFFSSGLLIAAALQSILIYRMRRHRVDDYRGRYRLWVWIPLVWVGMAVHVSTHVGSDLVDLVARLTPWHEWHTNQLYLPLAGMGLWLLVGARLVFEMQRSRGAVVFLTLATLAYATAQLTSAGLLILPDSILRAMATSSAALLGYLATLCAMCVYSRFVYLEAHGLLAVKAKRERSVAKKKVRKAPKAAPAPKEAPVAVEPKPARTVEPKPTRDAETKPARETESRPPRDAEPKPVRDAEPKANERKAPELVRRPEPETAKAEAPKPAAPKPTPVAAPARPAVLSVKKQEPARPTPSRIEDDDDDDFADEGADEGGDEHSKMSKAERRRLRKLGRRDQLRKAA